MYGAYEKTGVQCDETQDEETHWEKFSECKQVINRNCRSNFWSASDDAHMFMMRASPIYRHPSDWHASGEVRIDGMNWIETSSLDWRWFPYEFWIDTNNSHHIRLRVEK